MSYPGIHWLCCDRLAREREEFDAQARREEEEAKAARLTQRRRGQRLGWERVPGPTGGTLGATWIYNPGGRLQEGQPFWRVYHCGHPTANYPYAVVDPEGNTHVAGGMIVGRWAPSRAFRRLVLAQEYVEQRAGLAAKLDELPI